MNGKMKLIIAMLIYGSICIFVRHISLSAIEIAFLRAFTGSLFLILTSIFIKKANPFKFYKKERTIFIISGIFLGINWFFLFKAFEYTSISNAILVYYLAPIIVIFLSPMVLGEKLTPHKILCALTATIGLSMIVLNNYSLEVFDTKYFLGIGFALLAAIFYASVILINKKVKDTDGFESTIIQLSGSVLALLPIILMDTKLQNFSMDKKSLTMIIILGVLHTGIAYLMYFSSIKDLDAQTVAIYCYIDPISAMLFAWMFLGETMNIVQILGGLLILGATYAIDMNKRRYSEYV
ncbi:DMT family transporter [Peptostreptococcaceae bacterium AGR-M142]